MSSFSAGYLDETAQVLRAMDPAALEALKQVAKNKVRVAYVPSTDTGTRWFADKSIWVQDMEYLPFSTESGAKRYVDGHPGAETEARLSQSWRVIPVITAMPIFFCATRWILQPSSIRRSKEPAFGM